VSRYVTKAAVDLAYGDRIVSDGRVYRVVDRAGIVSTHSPGRIGWLVEGDDQRVYRLSVAETERVEIT